ncbi:MAG: alanine racemase [Planctomycetota bacterium]
MTISRAWAEVDLDALGHNLAVIRARAGPGTRLMLVVKADAYGHGAVAISHHAVRAGVSALGVGTSAEALELRRAGLRVPILVLGTLLEDELVPCLLNDVEFGLHASDRARSLDREARQLGRVARVHLNVDTGMGRLGVPPHLSLDLLRVIVESPNLDLAGIMTHLAPTCGAQDDACAAQMERFKAVLREAREAGLGPVIDRAWVHAANSAALFTGLTPLYDTVRAGIAAYGALPSELPGADELRPVLSLHSQVVFLKDVPAGTPVGYSGTFTTERPTRIATLAVGYADGLPWALGNRGKVLIGGREAPIIGRISMDYTTVDVGHLPGVEVGAVATWIGSNGGAELRLEQVAELAGTIPYELCCAIGPRVNRIFRGGEQLAIPSQPGFDPISSSPQLSPGFHSPILEPTPRE